MSGVTCAVVVCGDAGGGAAVAPVVELLRQEQRLTVTSLLCTYSTRIFERRALPFELMTTVPGTLAASARLAAIGPSVLVTGTSGSDLQPEKPFIAAARALGVPSLTVLDFWSGYRHRFSDEADVLRFVPNVIAVMDERARTEMIAAGFPPPALVVTGAPHLDDLARTADSFDEDRRRELRRALGVGDAEQLVLFASSPVAMEYGRTRIAGMNEREVLSIAVRSLDRIARERKASIVLALRPHPREDPNPSLPESASIRCVVAASGSGREWALASDLVLGLDTTLLLESAYLGRLTVSIQPGLRGRDLLPSNSSGLSLAVYEESEVHATLERALFDSGLADRQRAAFRATVPLTGASRRVADLIYSLGGLDADHDRF